MHYTKWGSTFGDMSQYIARHELVDSTTWLSAYPDIQRAVWVQYSTLKYLWLNTYDYGLNTYISKCLQFQRQSLNNQNWQSLDLNYSEQMRITQHLQDLVNCNSAHKNWKHTMKYQRKYTKELIPKWKIRKSSWFTQKSIFSSSAQS